jgi:hypothetical protein
MRQPIPSYADRQAQQQLGAGQAVADPDLARHLGTANPPVAQAAPGNPIYDTPLGRKALSDIQQELKDAGWNGTGDAVSIYIAITSGGDPPPGSGISLPKAPPTLTGVPTQTGPWQFAPTPNELASEANQIQQELMREGQEILQTQGKQAYDAWAKQQDQRLSVLNTVLDNPYLQELTGMAPGPGESAGMAPNLQRLVSDVTAPYQFPSWYQPGTQPGGLPYSDTPAPTTTARTTVTPTTTTPAAPPAPAAATTPALPAPSSQSNIPEGTARTRTIGAGQALPSGQVSTNELNARGYADTPEGRAQFAAGQPPSGNGAATLEQQRHALQVLGPTASVAGTATAGPVGWRTWRGWNPFERSAYITNQLAGQYYGGQPWATTRRQLMSEWGAEGGGPDITRMQRAAATPEQQVGQEMTGVVYGQKPEQWQQSQEKQWSRAQAPSVKQQLVSPTL